MGDDLCVIVHKSGEIPMWEIFYVYYEVWLMLLASYFIIAIVWKIMQNCSNKFTGSGPKYFFNFTETFRLMIATSYTREPTILSERLFLVFCMMAIVTFLGAFQGSLITIFSTPSHYPNVKTLDMLADKNYPIYTRFEGIKNDMFGDDSNNPTIKKLRNLVAINKSNTTTDKLIVKYGNVAGVLRRSSVDLDNKTR